MTGLVTSGVTGSVIFTESDNSDGDINGSNLTKVYGHFKKTFTWFRIDQDLEDVELKKSDENTAQYIDSLKLKDEYQAPKYPIILCHGLSGFDRLVFVPSFNLLSSMLLGKDLSSFSAMEDKGGLFLDYWYGIKDALQAKGSTVLVAKVPGFGSIDERAAELNSFIQRHAEKLGRESKQTVYNDKDNDNDDNDNDEDSSGFESEKSFKEKKEKIKVNLIAHSMGGLDCRYLISKLEKGNYEVASLTTITTPHKGSEMADYCVELAQKLPTEISLPPSIYQLTTSYLKEFNKTVTDDPNVLYMSYGACFKPKWYNVFFGSWTIIHQTGGANDGMVSVDSARWGTYLGTLTNVDHLDLINWTNAFKRVVSSVTPGSDDNRMDTLALYLDIADNLAKRGF
jgi:triacylglycerol lipase